MLKCVFLVGGECERSEDEHCLLLESIEPEMRIAAVVSLLLLLSFEKLGAKRA